MTEDLPKNIPNILENNIKINEESSALREIFNFIEESQRIKTKELSNKKIFNDKLCIKSNLNVLKKINDMKNCPKNKYKLKLQKIITPKSIFN